MSGAPSVTSGANDTTPSLMLSPNAMNFVFVIVRDTVTVTANPQHACARSASVAVQQNGRLAYGKNAARARFTLNVCTARGRPSASVYRNGRRFLAAWSPREPSRLGTTTGAAAMVAAAEWGSCPPHAAAVASVAR